MFVGPPEVLVSLELLEREAIWPPPPSHVHLRSKIVHASDKTKHAIQFFVSISSNATDFYDDDDAEGRLDWINRCDKYCDDDEDFDCDDGDDDDTLMTMRVEWWIGSIGVININEQAVKSADAKIMDALSTHTSQLEQHFAHF